MSRLAFIFYKSDDFPQAPCSSSVIKHPSWVLGIAPMGLGENGGVDSNKREALTTAFAMSNKGFFSDPGVSFFFFSFCQHP